MGKASLIVAAALAIIGVTYALGMQRSSMDEVDSISDHQYEAIARNASIAGYHRAKQVLVDDFNSPPSILRGTYEGVEYEVEISKESSLRATIKSTGIVDKGGGKEVIYNVKDEYLRKVITPDEVSKYQKHGLLADGSLNLGGDTDVGVYADGAEQNKLNANMHTNADLDVRGNAASVKGYGTYVGSASGKLEAFEPYNIEETSADPVYQADPVEIPEVTLGDWVADMVEVGRTVEKIEGTHKINGNTDSFKNVDYGGTREDPKIFHITGDLTVAGNVSLDGYNIFMVEGNVDLSGGAKLRSGDSGYHEGDESSIAIYGAGGIELGGSSEVWAQIFVEQEVASQKGSPHIYGNVTTRGDITLRGDPQIYYREASTALVVEGLKEETRRLSYNEWSDNE